MSGGTDYGPLLDAIFADAKAAFDPLAAKYKAQLKELEEDSRAVLDDARAGHVTLDEGKAALATAARALRSVLVSGAYDAAATAPGLALALLEKFLPIVLKLLLA